MRSVTKFAWVAGCFGLLLTVAGCGAGSGSNANTAPSGQNGATSGVAANAQVVHVVATDFKWTLDKTTLSSGNPIEFDITSKGGTHGFSIVGTSVSKVVSQGQTVDVTWTPPKSGRYIIRCDVYCGSGHPNMFTPFKVSS